MPAYCPLLLRPLEGGCFAVLKRVHDRFVSDLACVGTIITINSISSWLALGRMRRPFNHVLFEAASELLVLFR